jgi:thiol:disulfide interchange protein DsbD
VRRNLFIAALALLFATGAQAQDNMVRTELLLDAAAPMSGDTAWAGIHFTIPPEWHIYWQNPGDSGIPTTIKWTLPEGVEAGEIRWPAAERVVMGDLVNYGYSNEVTLAVPLPISRDGAAGDVSVKVDWLVCHETCIPESAVLTGSLPYRDERAVSLIAAARDAVPIPFPGEAHFAADKNQVQLTLTPNSNWDSPRRAEFLPVEDGVMQNNSVPTIQSDHGITTLTFARGSTALPSTWHGALWLEWEGHKPVAYAISAEASMAPLKTPSSSTPLLIVLGLAFIGGLLLNIMPCVLPVLSLKALALVKKAQMSHHSVRMQGAAYTAGVVLSFLLIAGVMLALKASGSAVGWGFQLQSPVTVFILFLLMLGVSLNLLGLFKLPALLGHSMVEHDGVRGTFLTGVLAVAVATPCTAPFMATAIGATLTLPAALSLLMFTAMGLGMASPFLLISLWPAAQRLLPKPGHWMIRFRQILALPMAATAIWLLYVFVQLVHPMPMKQGAGYDLIQPIAYSESRLAELRASNVPVFVDATAAWCLTCKVNAQVALKPERVQRYFAKHHITLMIADWTARDEAIAAYLATFGRNGVPIYVFYPPGKAPVILPQVLTPSLVLDTLDANMTKP